VLFLKSEDLEKWRLAGNIASKVLDFVAKRVRKGARILDLCEEGEKLIRKLGGKPAFPLNISINEIAAHYTSPPLDANRIGDNSFVKIDVGAHVDGFIGDVAKTVYTGKNSKAAGEIMKAAMEALQVAIDMAKDGVRVGELSAVIHKVAHDRGYGVLKDLNGHEIKRYNLHAGLTVPNTPKVLELVGLKLGPKLKEGMVLAIEPFLITSQHDSETNPDYKMAYIFSLRGDGKKGGLVYKRLYGAYKGLPFALRWIVKNKSGVKKVLTLLGGLEKKNLLHVYPALIEVKGRRVVQFEHTILIKKSSAEVLTLHT
jgi:methionyl aminopeptidase